MRQLLENGILAMDYTDTPGFAVTLDEAALTDEMKAEIARARAGQA
jgi:hypothetical protein